MFSKLLFDSYNDYRETGLNHRRFKHKDILSLILKRDSKIFSIDDSGKSYEGRTIFLLKAGKGKRKIFLWSQMHGNEPTATQALFDIFNFFENPKDLSEEAKTILDQCTLYFIPMLNPDGAERFQRRNAQDIDINRDALRLEAPESKLLMGLRDELKPEFGFNLHDQDIWYTAGDTKYPATISFLAPSYNIEKEIDEKRKRSMQVISSMNNILQNFIPNQTAKYNDDFMPTAFGDNVQKRGTSTILIESGGQYNDIEKQYVRKLNFVAILHALKLIGDNSFKNEDIADYEKLPFNKKNKLFDFILRNAFIIGEYGKYRADIGIRSILATDKDEFIIEDIGDLSHNDAYYEENLGGEKIDTINIGDDAIMFIEKYFKKYVL